MSKTNFLGAMVIMIAFMVSSCTTKSEFLSSSVVPAARGYIKVNQDKNDNYEIHVEITGLVEVDRLQPPKEAYVVWMITDNNITKNLGQINSASGMLSKNLKASFTTSSPFKPTKIFITAENDPAISYPGTHVVLSTDRF
jgi:hypothetical protein